MSDLSLSSIELVSSLRTAALNGPPSSSDYNTFQSEVLSDLTSLANFIDEIVNPLLNTLPAAAVQGLDGGKMYADRTVSTPLYQDANGNFYTVSQVLAALSAAQGSVTQQVANISASVTLLQTRLATTQQNDLRAAVQTMRDTVSTLTVNLTAAMTNIANQTLFQAKQRALIVPLPVNAAGPVVVAVAFNPPMVSNNYAVALAIEGTAGIVISQWSRNPDNSGLSVTVTYDGTSPSGSLHVLTQGC
jgi:hypothetical protein